MRKTFDFITCKRFAYSLESFSYERPCAATYKHKKKHFGKKKRKNNVNKGLKSKTYIEQQQIDNIFNDNN
jgi:hypothetical protein